VLILIAIAVPVLFAIQTWLSSQVSKLPSAPQASASYSVTYSQGNTILTIKVTNQYADKSLDVVDIRITHISGGSTNVQRLAAASAPFALRDPTSLNPGALGPKSDRYYVIAASGAITVIDVSITFRDTTTGATFEIKEGQGRL
jgi:glutamine phosphoribosylpyrophosphate amidotransferase